MKLTYHIITYGCQMNTADSEEMAQPLIDRGFVATADPKQADVILMNTCTVRDQAEHRAQSNLGRLRGWKAQDPNRVLIVAGCAASLWGESIKKRYPYIDLVAPATQIEKFPELVGQVLKDRWNFHDETVNAFRDGELANRRIGETEVRMGGWADRRIGETPTADTPIRPHSDTPTPFLFGDDQTAYVTIMRGCNYTCSYCIVPQVRGREVYRPMPEILDEIRTKSAAGYKEVMLLGQTVNSYHYRTGESANGRIGQTEARIGGWADGRMGVTDSTPIRRTADTPIRVFDFADLLRAVNAIEGIERIRFMSPHPKHMRERVIEAMRDSAKVCRHIHLPVQSGSNTLLKEMKRLYTRDEYLTIIKQLRAAMPGILITTDLIVGYPGETESDFADSLSLMNDVQFDGLFAFKFSPRPGTEAGEKIDDVPEGIKEARLQKVLALNTRIKQEKL